MPNVIGARYEFNEDSYTKLIRDLKYNFDHIDSANLADATLIALAAYNTNGLITQTAADTFTGRTIVGTANQVNVSNGNGVSGNPTLSTPQDIHTGATPTFANIIDSGLTASRLVQSNGSKQLASVSDLTSWVAGTANRVTVSNDGDGTITLSAPQDLHTSATPTFAGAILGSTDHNTMFDSSGHQTMEGNARPWRDELGDAISLQQTGPGISRNAAEATVDYSTVANLADYLYTNVQLNHDKDLTANIYPHIHYIQNSSNVPNFLLRYRWQVDGGTWSTSWNNIICNNTAHAYTAGSTIHQIAYTTSISAPVNAHLSDIVQFRVIRDTTNATALFTGIDPYTETVSISAFDVHFQINSLGSDNEFTK